ncbi:MAG: RIO1 family regulatory kinase/ATPase [Bacillota bacterium]
MEHEKLLYQNKEIKNYRIEEKFYSKKNYVYKVRIFYHDDTEAMGVIKVYNDNRDALYKEVQMLRKLKEYGMNVPVVHFVGEDYLIMEYINGNTLLEIISHLEEGKRINHNGRLITTSCLVVEICKWLKSFYEAAKDFSREDVIFGDTHLRNFILADQLYGIDFENCTIGKGESDCGKMCAYILTYAPAFTPWKQQFTKELIRGFTEYLSFRRETIIMEMRKEIIILKERRNRSASESIDGESIINLL